MKNTQLIHLRFLTLLAGACLLTWAAPQAQDIDPLWQVINDSPTQVIPLYMGQSSPFASAEVRVDSKEEIQISEEEILRAEKLKQAGELKKEIQTLMAGPLVLLPEVSNLMAQAYSKGARGDMALIGSRWYAEKALFTVPTYKNPTILSKINDLESISVDDAAEMNAALYGKHSQTPTMKLQIEKIGPKEVIFDGPQGKITLPVRQNSSQW